MRVRGVAKVWRIRHFPVAFSLRSHSSRLLFAQLIGLERKTARSGRDSIDHAPGAHDDIANCVSGVLTLADTHIWAKDHARSAALLDVNGKRSCYSAGFLDEIVLLVPAIAVRPDARP